MVDLECERADVDVVALNFFVGLLDLTAEVCDGVDDRVLGLEHLREALLARFELVELFLLAGSARKDLLPLALEVGTALNGLDHGLYVHGLPLEPELHDFEGVNNGLGQVLDTSLGLKLVRMLEDHEVLELLSSVELEIRLLIAAEELTHLSVEDPLVVETGLESLDLVLEALHGLVHAAHIPHESVDGVDLVLQLGLRDAAREREVLVDADKVVLEG